MSGRRSRRISSDSESEESEEVEIEVPEQEAPPPKRGRGRPPGSSKKRNLVDARSARQMQDVPLDESGKPYQVKDDELVLETDEEGEKKVTVNGELLGDREYRVRTFTIDGRGDKLYMLSTEPARCVGFRDSYLLFQKHRKLWKIILSDEEKFNLIERDVLPHSYKGRVIGVVTARSVYREFGAKIIVGGKKVTDDYYEAEAIAQGAQPGEIADPDDRLPPAGQPYNKNQYVAWHGASSVYHQSTSQPPVTPGDGYGGHQRAENLVSVHDDNWLYEHAAAASAYNATTTRSRRELLRPSGAYEPHVGLPFYPRLTQPSHAAWTREKTGARGVTISTVLHSSNRVARTGLADVDPSVYASLPEDLQAEIRTQIGLERAN